MCFIVVLFLEWSLSVSRLLPSARYHAVGRYPGQEVGLAVAQGHAELGVARIEEHGAIGAVGIEKLGVDELGGAHVEPRAQADGTGGGGSREVGDDVIMR